MEDNKNITTQESEVKEETKTYTADEVNKMIEEGRKQALEEANKKADERFQNKLKESEKLAMAARNRKWSVCLKMPKKLVVFIMIFLT